MATPSPAAVALPAMARHYLANATWPAFGAIHTVIPAKARAHAAWVLAFAGMTILGGVCYVTPQ